LSGEWRYYKHFLAFCNLFYRPKMRYFEPLMEEYMLEEDLEPQKQSVKLKNLEPLSIDELLAYIEDMKQEIVRTEAEIKRKKAHMDAAASVFK
jgi:uncharacterized small protein (DUF1192 family)